MRLAPLAKWYVPHMALASPCPTFRLTKNEQSPLIQVSNSPGFPTQVWNETSAGNCPFKATVYDETFSGTLTIIRRPESRGKDKTIWP
jgi:hypothetical protein